MKIRGAVLEQIGAARPYAVSKPITVCEVDLDEPGPDEILVKIEAAGLCHSDLSVVDGNRPRPVPMLLGHESAGRVEKVGTNVTDLEVGGRVVMAFLPRCGKCAGCLTDGRLPCEPGTVANGKGELLDGGVRLHRDGEPILHHLGVSGFATYAVVDRRSVVPVPDTIPAHIAAVLGCAVLTGGGAVLNAGNPQEGEDVLVVGLGGVGMSAILAALALGKGKVIGVDAQQSKLDQAKALGVDEVYTPDQAVAAGVKAAVVVEAAGIAPAYETAFALTKPGGRTITVSLPHPDARAAISPATMTIEARTLIGSYLGSAVPSRDISTYAEMWLAGRLPVEHLISSSITLDEINDAMDQLADGKVLRQIIRFDQD